VKNGTNRANRTEEDRLPDGDELPRDREDLTQPRELWGSLILEENRCEQKYTETRRA